MNGRINGNNAQNKSPLKMMASQGTKATKGSRSFSSSFLLLPTKVIVMIEVHEYHTWNERRSQEKRW